MKKHINVFRIILIVVLLIGFVLSLLWHLNGSLEMFPTAEQEEKAKIVSLLFMFIFAGSSIACIFPFITRKKNK